MQDYKTNIPIHLRAKKVKVTTELCQHFGSDRNSWVVFNIQLSYSIHICKIMRGTSLHEIDTYIFWSQKVRVTIEICHHLGSDTKTWVVLNIQLSYLIHRCSMVRPRYLFFLGSKGQELNFVNTLDLRRKLKYVLTYSFIFCTEMLICQKKIYVYILRSEGQVKCHNFFSNWIFLSSCWINVLANDKAYQCPHVIYIVIDYDESAYGNTKSLRTPVNLALAITVPIASPDVAVKS